MVIIEAMNELKIINKRLLNIVKHIQEYSSSCSIVKCDIADNLQDAKAKIKSEIQSGLDLIARYNQLKAQIDYTNLVTTIMVAGKKCTIHDALISQRNTLKMRQLLWSALSKEAGEKQMMMASRSMPQSASSETKKSVQVDLHYDIEEQRAALSQVSQEEEQIDSALQIANTITQLKELPA